MRTFPRTFLASMVVTGAALVAGIGVTVTDPGGVGREASSVVVIDANVASDAMLDDLIGQGFRGDPGDGREALYVPRDVAVAACVTDTDCLMASSPLR